MRELLNTLGKTLLDIGNFGLLLVLFMYIYALVGLESFANRFHFGEDGRAVHIAEEGYDSAWVPRSNFDTLVNAFTTIFEASFAGGFESEGASAGKRWRGRWGGMQRVDESCCWPMTLTRHRRIVCVTSRGLCYRRKSFRWHMPPHAGTPGAAVLKYSTCSQHRLLIRVKRSGSAFCRIHCCFRAIHLTTRAPMQRAQPSPLHSEIIF